MKIGLSIWDEKLKTKYKRNALKLQGERDAIIDAVPLDYNKLDRVERSILRLYHSGLVEVSG